MSTGYQTTLRRNAIAFGTKTPYVLSHGKSTTVSQMLTLPAEDDERAYVSGLWAADWNSAEDSGYDSL
jgi:hypothetical protein